MFPTRIRAHGRRLAPHRRDTKRPHPNLLSLDTPVPHAMAFVHGDVGGVGALHLANALHLAAGPDVTGWRIASGALEALDFGAPQPPELTSPRSSDPTHGAREETLATLSWARVVPAPGDRYVLASGLTLDPQRFVDVRDAEAALAALPTPEAPGFFARLRGATAERGAALVVDVVPDEPAPEALLPWLEFYQRQELEYHCWGTEGGGELSLFRARLEGDVEATLLHHLRHDAGLEAEQLSDLYEIWRQAGIERDASFTDLFEGEPHRGCYRPMPLDELAEVFVAHDDHFGDDLSVTRSLPGALLVERLRATTRSPAALALHAEPSDESVVVWFIAGGVDPECALFFDSLRSPARQSLAAAPLRGEVVGLLSERVWS